MTALYSWTTEQTTSLFERIQGKSSGSSQSSRMNALLNSIKLHLSYVLNSRPGACQSANELGVIDLNDATITAIDFQASLEEAITNCILNYEPRISNVVVRAVNDDIEPLALDFNITATIALDNHIQVAEFNIQLDNNRRYRLNRT